LPNFFQISGIYAPRIIKIRPHKAQGVKNVFGSKRGEPVLTMLMYHPQTMKPNPTRLGKLSFLKLFDMFPSGFYPPRSLEAGLKLMLIPVLLEIMVFFMVFATVAFMASANFNFRMPRIHAINAT
jgi:hypothetical protein